MNLHVLSIPYSVTSKEYLSCAFTQKVWKFCKMMMPYYKIIHYGHERSTVSCHEHVTVIDDAVLLGTYGHYNWKEEFFRHNINDLAHKTFNQNTKNELEKRVTPGDGILCFWGAGVADSVKNFENICFIIEPGIGYKSFATFAPFKVFESYSHMHNTYGALGVNEARFYDAVIPNYFDISDFEYSENKDNYFLYLGRVTQDKGLNIAIGATKEANAKLIIAGQGSLADIGYKDVPDHVEHIGFADVEKRKLLLKKAKGLFLSTLYLEPFGGVIIEAMLSGTPVITTDWGVFPENNLHGITGYRCRNDEQFIWATKNIEQISPQNCREWAEQNFSLARIAKMYDSYFKSLQRNFEPQGKIESYISAQHTELNEIDWLNRQYPYQTNDMGFI